jgi:hypothetical protein
MSDCHVLMSWSDGSQTFPNPREYSGVSGRPVDSAWVDPLRASLATNVVFPARADQVRLSGRTVIFPHSVSPTEPFVVPSAAANENTTLMLVQRGVCVVVRVIRADAVSLADTVRMSCRPTRILSLAMLQGWQFTTIAATSACCMARLRWPWHLPLDRVWTLLRS